MEKRKVKLADGREAEWHVSDTGDFTVWSDGQVYKDVTLAAALAKVKRKSVKIDYRFCKIRRKEEGWVKVSYMATGINNGNSNLMVKEINPDGTFGRAEQMDGHDWETPALALTVTDAEVQQIGRLKDIIRQAEAKKKEIEKRHGIHLRHEVEKLVDQALIESDPSKRRAPTPEEIKVQNDLDCQAGKGSV